jgi:hypothetical protein
VVTALLVVAVTMLMAAGAVPAQAPAGPSAKVNPALKNAPGYYPPADPESMSVVYGRRLNAPEVSQKFAGGTRSMDELGIRVARALHRADRDSLQDLCVTREEFSVILWPEFPESRPITGLKADDGWFLLDARHQGGISRALATWGGQHLRFVRWERADTIMVFKNYRLHRGLTLVALDESGAETRLDFVRTVAERKGRYKLYSLKD